MDGFLLVDKEVGMTSQQVVSRIKKKFNLNKCGHNGTLDPAATGLLVVGCDRGTKLLNLLSVDRKTYNVTIVFGFETTTLDLEGEITCSKSMSFTEVELDDALKELSKQTLQIPPMISAIKLGGKKLYEYARENQEVKVEPRKIEIFDCEITKPLTLSNENFEVGIKISASKGFYVRSFARDLGKMLGGYATVKELRRLSCGDYSVGSAKTIADLTTEDIMPIEMLLKLPYYEAKDHEVRLVLNGAILDERQISIDRPFYVTKNGKILAVYEVVEYNKYHPVVIFKD